MWGRARSTLDEVFPVLVVGLVVGFSLRGSSPDGLVSGMAGVRHGAGMAGRQVLGELRSAWLAKPA
ncbi:hypothetical protein JCM33774_35320 [Actinophytocola sp. KF-1]